MNTGWLLAGLVPHSTTRSLSMTSGSEQVVAADADGLLQPDGGRGVAHPGGGVDAGDAHGPGRLAGDVVHLVGDAPAGEVAAPSARRRRGGWPPASASSASSQEMRRKPGSPRRRRIGWPSRPSARSSLGAEAPERVDVGQHLGSKASAVFSSSRRRRVVQRWTPSIVQSCRPATPERAAVAHALGQDLPGVAGVAPVGPRHLGHLR